MWTSVVQIIVDSVSQAFDWFNSLILSIPGAWDTVFTIIVILLLSRFLLGPLLGAAFRVGQSDSARQPKKSGSDKEDL